MSDAGDPFDYVVVGAGSAGCVVASRLSEDPATRVLLLEAGPRDTSPWIHLPVGYYRTMFDPRVAWSFDTEPDPGLNGRTLRWPRGRVVGGSSSINGLAWVRGQPEDYDHWRQLGNEGWSFEDVLPCFKRAECYAHGDPALRGRDGPLGIAPSIYRSELMDAFVEAAKQAGLPENPDYNGATQEGVAYFQVTIRNGLRQSAATAYLRPARRRPNLELRTGALTLRLLLDGRRVTGVEYRRDGAVERVTARREVVLSAGAIGSPHLLLLSGIGPGEHLRKVGVEVRHHLPGVGQGLQDHFQARAVYRSRLPVTINDATRTLWRKGLIGLQWALTRKGPLTVAAGVVALFARTRPEVATPDVQFHVIPFSADRPGQPLHAFSGYTISVCQLRPESRGSLCLRDADPATPPVIRPNYLATETDRRTMVEALKLARRIMGEPVMARYREAEVFPGPEVASDAQLLDYVRNTGTTIFHPSCTCRMGPEGDAGAVVDSRLRVRGLAGLRVADASIMPAVVSGNTNAPTIMIGEKGADMNRADARAD
ncbi:MAG TPA: choline dehydrogenase [Geminicoccaceae bacterium]|nr:choline dehydrogenase [Geminicoccaceae bacterium]